MTSPNNQGAPEPGEDLIDRVLERLERVRQSGRGWSARCPAHEDRNPSLSVTVGEDGRVLLLCHAGCPFETVLAALDLTPGDLFAQPVAGHTDQPEVVYPYVNEEGTLLYEVVRLPDKQFRVRRPSAKGGYVWDMRGVERVLYRLPKLLAAVGKQTVYIVEGEKDADAIHAVGGVATTNVGGAGKWKTAYREVLRDADVVIVADRDGPGQKHAEQVRKSLDEVAASVRIVVAKEGKDASDHLAAGYGLDDFELPEVAQDDLVDLSTITVDAILAASPPSSRKALLAQNPGLKKLLTSGGSLADQLVKLVQDSHVVLFHDEEPRAYASFSRDGHRETWPLRSKRFKIYVRWLCHSQLGRTPNGHAVGDALGRLEAAAMFDGEQFPVFLRVASAGGATYIDLGDPGWRAIRVSATGWEIVTDYPVYFRRASGMAPLPLPVRGGSLTLLLDFVNLSSEDDYRLLIGWLLASLRPPGQPYPVLILHGEQGSAKSTSARILRSLIDPSSVPLRAAPRDLRDLMVSANASWMLTLDNLSRLDPWLSDALCRIATGGGFATRELYTDEDEVIFDAQRPVIMNGIEEIATRSDLLDRALLIQLPPIPAEQRRNERDLWAAFEQAKPALLGSLLDGQVAALANIETAQLERLPRMADFALWVTAAEQGLGWEPGAFMASYEGNRGQAHELAVEASPAGQALVDIAAEGFRGTASDLLRTLNMRADEALTRQRGWPASAKAMSGLVKRLAPNLRELGYQVDFYREPGGSRRRIIELCPAAGKTVPTDPTVPNGSPSPEARDGRDATPNEGNPDSPQSEPLPESGWDDRDDRDDRDDWDDPDWQRPIDGDGGSPSKPLPPY